MHTVRLLVEYPPFGPRSETTTLARLVWTDDPNKHQEPTHGGAIYWYLAGTLMHELGHTVGLEDLSLVAGFDHALMSIGWKDVIGPVIPSVDIRYVKQVYRNHGGEPH